MAMVMTSDAVRMAAAIVAEGGRAADGAEGGVASTGAQVGEGGKPKQYVGSHLRFLEAKVSGTEEEPNRTEQSTNLHPHRQYPPQSALQCVVAGS